MPLAVRLAVLPVVVLAHAGLATLPASAATLHTRATARGLVAEVRQAPRGRALVFIVAGHRVAVRRSAPFRVVIGRTVLRHARHARLVVRSARTGRVVAARTLSANPHLSPASSKAPTVTLVTAPPASTTDTTATISWTAQAAQSTTCSLDAAAAAACSSPVALSGLAVGDHVFTVTAVNRWGTARVSASWTVLAPATPPPPAPAPAPAPAVTLTSTPAASTTDTTAAFAFTATNATATACALDGAAGAACSSSVSYAGLAVGTHTFVVTASGGSLTASATFAWTISSPTSTAPPPAPAPAVALPAPPAPYSVPAGAVQVSTSAQLSSALASGAKAIVLADGTYDAASPFSDTAGSSLYAANLGKAVLTAGLVIGGNYGSGGATVQGLTFDVRDTAKVLGGGIVHVWGAAGGGTHVLDTVFRGNWAIPVGLLVYNPSGLHVERVQFSSFTDEALRASDNVLATYGATVPKLDVVSDVLVDGVHRAVSGSSNGTAEAGLWIGEPVVNGVHRIQVRNVGWTAIETCNNSWDTSYTDLTLDLSGSPVAVGVYLEHYSRQLVFDRFAIKAARIGFNAEWNDPAWGGVAGAHFVTIRNGSVDAAGTSSAGHQAGVYLDAGTESTTVSSVVFTNQNWAAIGAYQTIGTNSFTSLTTTGILAGAVALTTSHI